jgi:hypothetical protein
MRQLLVLVLVVGCRSQVDLAPAPSSNVVASPPKRIFEPTIACGIWSPCVWLELDHLEQTYEVYRIAGSDAGRPGSHFWRAHDCYPFDAGPEHCSRYCNASGACVDGLVSDDICTHSRPPSPAPFACEVRDGACVAQVPAPRPP